MKEAGFFRMLQPKRWGGLEVHPNTFFANGPSGSTPSSAPIAAAG
jgi:hypothetical protein